MISLTYNLIMSEIIALAGDPGFSWVNHDA